jgi:hypothetical protein
MLLNKLQITCSSTKLQEETMKEEVEHTHLVLLLALGFWPPVLLLRKEFQAFG